SRRSPASVSVERRGAGKPPPPQDAKVRGPSADPRPHRRAHRPGHDPRPPEVWAIKNLGQATPRPRGRNAGNDARVSEKRPFSNSPPYMGFSCATARSHLSQLFTIFVLASR